MLGVIEAVSRLTGLEAVWKNASGSGEGNLPLEVYSHGNPFCLAVKELAGGMARCRRDDNVRAARRAEQKRRPFFKTCHAGVTELVVPLFDAGRFDGLLFLGPVRRRRARCGYASARGLFRELPEFDAEVFASAEVILRVVAAELAFRKQSLRLREAEARELDPRIAQAVAIIKSELHETLRARDLARRCYLSPSRFVHLFKESLGVPVSTYIAQTRVERAKALLSHSDLALSRIAAEVGFPDQNYFATVFRRHCAMAPSHYRARTRDTAAP
jgi:AraC-like DNA-binding protein/ligand-binding sensor protein